MSLFHYLRIGADKTKIAADLIHKFCELDQIYFPNPWELSSWNKLFFDSPQELCCVWESEGEELIGLCLFLVNSEDSFAHLVKIFTRKSHKKKGHASKLLRFAQDLLIKGGVEQFYLEVESDNLAAIGLYHKFGYRKIHHRRHFYGSDRHAEIMELRVPGALLSSH